MLQISWGGGTLSSSATLHVIARNGEFILSLANAHWKGLLKPDQGHSKPVVLSDDWLYHALFI